MFLPSALIGIAVRNGSESALNMQDAIFAILVAVYLIELQYFLEMTLTACPGQEFY